MSSPDTGQRPSKQAQTDAPTRDSALATLVHRYQLPLQRYVLRRIRQRQDVDDIVQTIFLNLSRVRDLGAVRDLERYLFKIASRVVSSSLMGAGRDAALINTDSEIVQDTLENPASWERDGLPDAVNFERELSGAFARLSLRQQAVLALACEGLTYQEISERCDISKDVVEREITAAHVQMKSMLWDLKEA